MLTTSGRKSKHYTGRTTKSPPRAGFCVEKMKYTVIYTLDYNRTQRAETVTAKDYTKAYLTIIYKNPLNTIILEVKTEDLKA